jgi:hypothetical protein
MEHTSGETHRSTDGNARATYHPEWSYKYPWVTYTYGTAGKHCATLQQAKEYLIDKGYRFPPNKE